MSVSTKIVVILGNPGVTYPLPVQVSRTIKYNNRVSVSINRTLVYNVATPVAASARFYGDPGYNHRHVGMEVTGGNATTFTHFQGELSKPYQLQRLYDSTGSPTTILAKMQAAVNGGYIPVQDIKIYADSAITYGNFRDGTTAANTYMSQLAATINSASGSTGMPIWLGINKEPEVIVTAANAAAARADARALFTYLHANCPTVVIVGPCYMMITFDYSNAPTSNDSRDWRIWDYNWKGTTTNFSDGTPSSYQNPNPVDWYSTSCYDIFAGDVYNWWGQWYPSGTGGTGYQAYTKYSALASLWNTMYATVGLIPLYANNFPFIVCEFASAAYCGSYEHGGSVTGPEDFGAANKATFLGEYSTFFAIPQIVGFCYWNSNASSPQYWDSVTDPDNWHVLAFNTVLAEPTTVAPIKS